MSYSAFKAHLENIPEGANVHAWIKESLGKVKKGGEYSQIRKAATANGSWTNEETEDKVALLLATIGQNW